MSKAPAKPARPAAPASTAEAKPAKKVVTLEGVVESDKRAKTRKVVVRFLAKHPKYGKFMRRETVIQAHDETNSSKLGDTVEIGPCRPVSKTKNWRVVRVVQKAVV